MNRLDDTGSEPRVRKARSEDLPAIAALHRAQFSGHFLGRYPHSILVAFYDAFLPDSIFLIAELDGRLAGFVLGGDAKTLQRCRREFTRTSWLQFSLATLVRPGLWVQAIRRIGILRRKKGGQSGFRSQATWRLLSIAVSDAAKGRGVAGVLVDAFEQSLSNATCYGLSVHDDNPRAIGFYRKIGFEEERVQDGAIYFTKRIESAQGNAEPVPQNTGCAQSA